MYVIVGATGNTGRFIAETLLKDGETVRVIGRDAARLKPLVDGGAEAFVASIDDTPAMVRAFTGATAVYTMIPPNYGVADLRAYHRRIAESLATALEQAQVPSVVNLSSLGAQLADGAGPISGLHDVEQRLNRLPNSHVLHLRPGYFMENLLWNRDLIATQGINSTPLRSNLAISMIATRDIATAATQRLRLRDFSGKRTQELLGHRDLTMTEATAIIGKVTGNPSLHYVQFPYEAVEETMLGMGMSADTARNFVELYRAFNEGRVTPLEPRTPANTTATSFEEFAAAFRAGA
ncbi:NmrA family NAD(P)-binding protein [Petrachloros mirabilis]